MNKFRNEYFTISGVDYCRAFIGSPYWYKKTKEGKKEMWGCVNNDILEKNYLREKKLKRILK